MTNKTWALMSLSLLLGAGLMTSYMRHGWLDMFLYFGIAASLVFYLVVKA